MSRQVTVAYIAQQLDFMCIMHPSCDIACCCPFAIFSSSWQTLHDIVAVNVRLWHSSSSMVVWSFPDNMHHPKMIPLQYTSYWYCSYTLLHEVRIWTQHLSWLKKISGEIHIHNPLKVQSNWESGQNISAIGAILNSPASAITQLVNLTEAFPIYSAKKLLVIFHERNPFIIQHFSSESADRDSYFA